MPRPQGEHMTGSASSPSGSTPRGFTNTWVIDHIENGVASIEADGDTTITIPRKLLPRGVKEGDVLRVTIVADPAEQARRLAQSAAQVARGGKGGQGNITL
jgi:hypothetical protein